MRMATGITSSFSSATSAVRRPSASSEPMPSSSTSEKLGATVRGSVSKTTYLLIAGDGTGSKAEKAAALGVKVMAAGEFVKLISR